MYKVISIAALAGLLFGFDTGIISGAILPLKDFFALDVFMVEVVVGIVLLGAFIGSICSARLTNLWSRRLLIEIDAILFIISTLCSSLAPSLLVLLLGRLGVGIAIGIACYIVPLYISELAPAHFRGRLVALNTIAVTGGILVSYLTSCIFTSAEAWRWMFGLGVIPAVFLWIGVRFLPESPRWLMKQGLFVEAKELLDKLRENPLEAEAEFQMIKDSLKQVRVYWHELLHPKIMKILLIGIVLAAVQQITGINTILYYAPILFQSLGFQSTSQVMLLTAAVGLINFLMTILVMWRVDKIGRKPLLLFGLGGMTVSLTILGLNLSPWAAIASLFAFVAFYASSIGCIFWIVIAEIYPLNIRGLAMGIASSVNWASNLLMTLTFLSLLEAMGPFNTFLCYAFFGLLSFLFCYRYLTETAQYSLEEIESKTYL